MAGDSARERGAYSTKLRSRRDNGCPSLAHSHAVSTQLYQTPLSFLPPRSSVLFFPPSVLFSPRVVLSSPHHRGTRGWRDGGGADNDTHRLVLLVGEGGSEEETTLFPLLRLAPPTVLCFSVGELGFNR